MSVLDRLDEIQSRADKATDGPWVVQEEEWAVISSSSDSVLHAFAVEKDCTECGEPQVEADVEVVLVIEDAEFIAHARTDVPWLIEQVRKLDAALRAVLDTCAEIRANNTGTDFRAGGITAASIIESAIENALKEEK